MEVCFWSKLNSKDLRYGEPMLAWVPDILYYIDTEKYAYIITDFGIYHFQSLIQTDLPWNATKYK